MSHLRMPGTGREAARMPGTSEEGGATARAVGERVSHWRVREDGMRPEAPAGGRHTSGGAVGGESSPSVGWRETAERMAASEGRSHR